MRVCTYVCMYACMYVCMYVCMKVPLVQFFGATAQAISIHAFTKEIVPHLHVPVSGVGGAWSHNSIVARMPCRWFCHIVHEALTQHRHISTKMVVNLDQGADSTRDRIC